MRVLSRHYDIVDNKRVIVTELANGRRLTWNLASDDARFFDTVSDKDVCMALRPLVPEEWSLSIDGSKAI